MATRPRSGQPPSRRAIFIAFAFAAVAACALVAMALLLRDDDSSGSSGSPTPVVDLTGIPQDDRVLGAPEATVTLIEYADAQCPGCRFYSEEVFPTVVDEYVRPGKINTEFHGFPFIGPDSVKALRFIYAAGLQDRLWQLQEALYRNQGGENDGWVTDELIRELAGEIPELDVDKLFADAESDEITQAADAANGEAEAAEAPGTPSLFVKIGDAEPYYLQVALDVEQLRTALDDALTP
jgi:protein-disulfide isomerase